MNKNISERMKKRWGRAQKLAVVIGVDKQVMYDKLSHLQKTLPVELGTVEAELDSLSKSDEYNDSLAELINAMQKYDESKEFKKKSSKENFSSLNAIIEDLKIILWAVNKIGSLSKVKKLIALVENFEDNS